MDQPANYLPYHATGYFTKIVTDYLSGSPSLRSFYRHTPDIAGIKNAIRDRKDFDTPRQLLSEVLQKQYEGIAVSGRLQQNLEALAAQDTFTVTTAHQPNIFTGPLYFIYKILHAIKLADELNGELPQYKFVPVYYMGSEDADLDELGYIYAGGQKLVWETKQTGAVGRMKVDKALIKLIHAIHGQAGVLPFGEELSTLFTNCYTEGKTIQQATLELVNILFGEYGLVILIPDNAKLKTGFQSVVEKELLEGFSHKAVSDTIERLGKEYKVQAGGREINLFYLIDNKRERIEVQAARYEVRSLELSFSREEILNELSAHPERFSANVILRGAFQETILPNIAFIGGGGELAYWLELKDVFESVQIPYPVLLLRNSFLLINRQQDEKINTIGFSIADLFRDEQVLFTELVKKESAHQLDLAKEIEQAHQLYAQLKKVSAQVDASLQEHVVSLETKAVKKLAVLEKKLLRAEKEKFEIQRKQLAKLKKDLFPGNSLQERVDNFSLYYAKEGKNWLQKIYTVSSGFNAGFGIIM
jgi:bacillithiol biosynthesis cysteine-adding enzyme BshC